MAKLTLLQPDELRERLLSSAERTYAAFARARTDTVVYEYFRPGTCKTCESPLEQVFYHAWLIASSLATECGDLLQLYLLPQYDIIARGQSYRLDFVVDFWPSQGHASETAYHQWKTLPWPKLAIELDGHDFHERTKEQVAYRNERDRNLQLDGWTVLHFSGTEITRDPVGVALTVAQDAYRRGEEAFCRSSIPVGA